MDFVIGLPHTRRKHDSIWVIVDRVIKSSRFLVVKSTDPAEDYVKLYINEIVSLHQMEVHSLPLISRSCFHKVLVRRLILAQHYFVDGWADKVYHSDLRGHVESLCDRLQSS